MDEIHIDDLEIFANHGVFDEEKKNGQLFYVNAVLYTDNYAEFFELDSLKFTVDYSSVCDTICQVMTENCFNLIETAADVIARTILHKYDRVQKVEVEVRKPNAPLKQKFKSVSFKLMRRWVDVVIALGSNMGDSENIINSAVDKFRKYDGICLRKINVSKLIVTKPYGYTDQPDFLNGVMMFQTFLSPHEIFSFMNQCEQEANRKRYIPWGPRTLDLDMIFYGDDVISEERLTVPHPDMQNRDFVLRPLNEIAPYMRHPITGLTVNQMLKQLEERND
jgi:dihydroneopterin aldolase/2-amino-4-hydroxy-6-hydroxymethyldihydropteridine diphosphokinase